MEEAGENWWMRGVAERWMRGLLRDLLCVRPSVRCHLAWLLGTRCHTGCHTGCHARCLEEEELCLTLVRRPE